MKIMIFKRQSWNFWNYSIGLITLLILIAFMIIKEINERDDLEANRKYSVGRVINFHYRKGNYAVVSFIVDEKVYESHFHVSWESFIGEKYMIKSSFKNPNNNITLLEKPVFTEDQKTDTTIGIITKFVSLPRGVDLDMQLIL
jgi:hypothetical protein